MRLKAGRDRCPPAGGRRCCAPCRLAARPLTRCAPSSRRWRSKIRRGRHHRATRCCRRRRAWRPRFPRVVAAYDRLRHGKEPVAAARGPGPRGQLALSCSPARSRRQRESPALDTYLVLAAEHSLNASHLRRDGRRSRRCLTTTRRSSPPSAPCAATAHGGANQKAMEMLMEIGSPDNVEPFVDHALADQAPPDGHGPPHLQDPRPARQPPGATTPSAWPSVTGNRAGSTSPQRLDAISRYAPLFRRAQDLSQRRVLLGAAALQAGLRARHDAGRLRLQPHRRLDRPHPEQLADNRIIRPSADYTGPEPRAYTPIAQRG